MAALDGRRAQQRPRLRLKLAMVETSTQGVARRTLRGMGWAYGSYAGLRLTTLIATAILARLLTPKDFGLVALATTVIAFLDSIQGLGIGQALVIADEDEVRDRADTAFTCMLGFGALLSILAAALGPAAATFFHQPELVAVLPALGSTFFILGFSSTHYALAMREIDFRSRTAAELTDAVVRGAVGISLALAGAGAWSLILGYICGNVAMAAVLWRMVAWRPRHFPSMRHARSLLNFGGYLTGVGLMAAFLTQFDNLVVGRVLGPTQLGFYSIATRIPGLFILSVATVAGQVLFPAFATLDGEALRRGVLTSLRYIATIIFPLTAFLIVLAQPIMIAVFGPHWYGAIDAARVLSLWAGMGVVSMVCGNAFMSRGRARLLFLLSIPQAVALVAGSLAAAPYGIVAVSWVQAAIAIVAQAVTLVIAKRMFSLRVGELLRAFLPPLLAAAGSAVVLLFVERLVAGAWPTIAIGALSGALVYFVLLHALAPDLLPGVVQLLIGRGSPQRS